MFLLEKRVACLNFIKVYGIKTKTNQNKLHKV